MADVSDVDAEMVEAGYDPQGILWDRAPFSREEYRATRLREHAATPSASLNELLKQADRTATFYRFAKNTRRVKSSIFHFQLRNLVWATSAHDVFMMHNESIVHWDEAAQRCSHVLDLSGVPVDELESDQPAARLETGIAPVSGPVLCEGGDGEVSGSGGSSSEQEVAGPTVCTGGEAEIVVGGRQPSEPVTVAPPPTAKITTMVAKGDLVIAGGFLGELVAKNLRTHVVEYNRRITYDDNAITNSIDVADNTAIISSNDCRVRVFDLPTFTKAREFKCEKPVNHSTRQPEGKMLVLACDDKPANVIDVETGVNIANLHGHEEYSFATGWHPNGNLFATGSQDRTCRVWDVRNMGQSLCVLGAHMGAMRSLRFSSCGRFLALAEPRDYVHLYDVSTGDFGSCQEIDLFGEIAGISFSPDADSLFIGMFDPKYGSLMEYKKVDSSTALC